MRTVLVLVGALCLGPLPASVAGFDDDFTGATMRVDYYHTGTAAEEHFALDRVRIEGPWPGSRTQLTDPSNLGLYLVEMRDRETKRVLYTRGFCSIYGEWATTAEARQEIWRCFPEAVRVPEPHRPVVLLLKKRDVRQAFQTIWQTTIEPTSRFVERPPLCNLPVWTLFDHGEISTKVDLLVLGDGYAGDEIDKFRADAERLTTALLDAEPFAAHRADFNVRAIPSPAAESGITKPREGVFRNSPLGVRCNAFDLPRYALTLNDRAWRDVAAAAPYDCVLILHNEQTPGGGGIHGLYAIAAADSPDAAFLTVHEFGHHFAGLADEYFAASVAYLVDDVPIAEPWEPNVTALLDPGRLKWRELVAPGTPIPTPWEHDEFIALYKGKKESQTCSTAPSQPRSAITLLGEQRYAGKVGAFEGAAYRGKGLYRPTVSCTMFVDRQAAFCPVCSRAIERAIELYTR